MVIAEENMEPIRSTPDEWGYGWDEPTAGDGQVTARN
jgi:hypothetical protein